MNIGAIAMRMLARGDSKSATELMRQVYESQPEHDASLELEDPDVTRDNRGLARYFYPQVALLDLDKALKLIHRDAYPKEIETLQSLAVLIAVAGARVDWTTAKGKLGQETFAGSEKSLVPGVFGGTPLPSLAFVKGFADRLPDLTSRGVMLVSAALDLPNATDDERRELLAQAADLMWRSSDRIHGGYYEQLAASLGNRIYRVASIDPALARRFVFECVWDLRGVKDRRAGNPGEAFSPVAEMLAGINAKLSHTLLEPFFVDFNWLMRDDNQLYQVTPLVSAARLDPSWAADIAIRLNASEFPDDRPRRTLVLDAVLVGLAESR